MRGDERHDVLPFLKIRRAYIDVLRAGRRKNIIHGLVELDVTDARSILRDYRAATGESLSFTAFLMHCVAAAVEENRIVHAYRRRNRLILFQDIDFNTQIDAELSGQHVVKSIIVRAANRKSVTQISDEIHRAQHEGAGKERRYRLTMAFLSLPGFLRAIGWRVVMANPRWFKRIGGTVAMSSIGMFGAGGGWGIPIAPPTLMVTVGGIARKPRLIDGELLDREFLSVTLSFDHDIVDGAPASRFSKHFADLVEGANGLPPRHQT